MALLRFTRCFSLSLSSNDYYYLRLFSSKLEINRSRDANRYEWKSTFLLVVPKIVVGLEKRRRNRRMADN